MFDIGFSELIIIGIVALVVIGPERLPKVARTTGLLLGRLQRYVNDVKADINREMQLDELKKLRSEMEESARDFERSMADGMRTIERDVGDAVNAVKSDVQSPAVPALGGGVSQAEEPGKLGPEDPVGAGRDAPSGPSPAAKGSDFHG